MIARTWRGATLSSDAETYLRYLEETGLSAYRSTPGNIATLVLRRSRGDRAELLLVSLWQDESAVHRFAGDDPEAAVFYPEDDRFLVERDETVDHYEVVFAQLPGESVRQEGS